MAHPRMYDDANPLIERLRKICLALPEVFEKEAWGECTFRVTGGSMFAMTDNNHHQSGHVAVWIKAPAMMQEALVASEAGRYFVPPYVGSKGWVGVRLDRRVDWEDVAWIVKDGYLMSAPKRLQARLAAQTEPTPNAGPPARRAPETAKRSPTDKRTDGRPPAARTRAKRQR